MTPNSAPHQLICIQELYELLLTQLDPAAGPNPYYDKAKRAALAGLARVSKMTSDPALDKLWLTLTTPSALIRLFPEDLVHLSDSGQYSLTRPMVESDFLIFDKYAHRVHVVDFEYLQHLGPGCELFSTLKTFKNPILPNLSKLKWHLNTDTLGASHLISRDFNLPRNQLSLTMWGRAELLQFFQLPDVPSLTLRTGAALSNLDILRGLQSMSKLQHFRYSLTGSMGLDILDHLSRIPHLQTLHIGDVDGLTVDVLRQTSIKRQEQTGEPSFTALQSLLISGPYSVLSSFLSIVSSNTLESVEIRLKDFSPIDSTLCSLLSRSSFTLRHFTFLTMDSSVSTHPRHSLFTMTVFAPLLTCTNLETVEINFDATRVEFNDVDVEKMTVAWPRLVRLKVFSRYTQEHGWVDPQVHLYTLWNFVERCRGLRELEMRVDARVNGPFIPPDGTTRPGLLSLRRICLFLSPCEAPTHVAEFLNLAFPRLTEFYVGLSREAEKSGSRVWYEVREGLPGIDRLRRELRARVAGQ
ncbi:hypothetical protein C8F04DRAFT_1105300 [Mycena alexandri]|uniref:F-box domain-containing protein n=1 Tax=Mycena alexandri TaxID=1745969 RepID=A0AAD6SVG4_9AGAR|nr:hypothetical protein C8F04DRAFT_1105300 [Mycena alexandri]